MSNKLLFKRLYFLILNFLFFQILPTSFSVTADGQTLTLDGDYYLGANSSNFGIYSSIIIDNTTGATRTVTLDGSGHTVYFPYNIASPTFQFTGDGTVLTVQNVSFQGYNPAAISYASTNAKIIFGDNTKLILDRDLSILYTDRTLTCSGNVLLDGQNLTLTASGENALSMQGLNKTLTIKNTILKPQGPDSICCLDGASKIVLSNSILELGRDGLAVNNGYMDIDGKVAVRGIDASYTGTQSLDLLTKRIQNLGFVPYLGNCKLGVYTLSLADIYSGNTTFTVICLNKENRAFYATSIDPYSVAWTEIVPSAVYKSIDIGDDGQMWAVKTDRTAHRVTRGAPPTILAATNVTGDYVAVGGANCVFVLNTVTGIVYQCNNPTNALDSWTAVSGVYFPRSIAAGSDGTLWFVATDGRVYRKLYQSTKIEQIFDGVDRDIVKISAAGSADLNCIALLTSMPKDGRVLVSQSGGPFRDLGINKVVDVGIGINGSLVVVFDNTAIAENPTYGGQIYAKFNTSTSQILTMDRSLTFSSDKYLTIKSDSELEFSNDVALRYQPNDLSDNYFQRRHLIFQDSTSTIKMNRSILDCGLVGLTLSNGNIFIDGPMSIYTNFLSGYELEISNQFNFFIKSGAIVNSIGPITYSKPAMLKGINSTYGVGLVAMNFSESQTLANLSQPYSSISSLGFTTLNPAHICYRGGIVSNLSTGNANRIAKCNGGGPGGDRGSFELRLNPTNTYAIDSFIAYNLLCREVSIGTDGMVAAVSYNASTYTDGVYINTVLAENLSTNIGLSGSSGAVYASIGASGMIYALKADGSVWKWVSGTTWNSVDLGAGNTGARFIAAGNDGTLWFINQYGNIRVKGMGGIVTQFPGGDGYNLSRVKVAGSYNDFKLIALDCDGNIYKASQNTSLTKIVVGKIMEVAIAKSGLAFVIFATNTSDPEQVKFGGLGYTGMLQV